MEGSRQINLAEEFTSFYVGGKLIEIWQLECILMSLAVDQTEVSARPLGAIRLGLED